MTEWEEDYPCECCGHDCADCICPECPVCGVAGDKECYEKGYLKYTEEQLAGQARLRSYQQTTTSEEE